jgi:hypothetical protein
MEKSGHAQYVIPRSTTAGEVADTETLNTRNDAPKVPVTIHIPPPNKVVCRAPFTSTGNWQA